MTNIQDKFICCGEKSPDTKPYISTSLFCDFPLIRKCIDLIDLYKTMKDGRDLELILMIIFPTTNIAFFICIKLCIGKNRGTNVIRQVRVLIFWRFCSCVHCLICSNILALQTFYYIGKGCIHFPCFAYFFDTFNSLVLLNFSYVSILSA